MAKNKYGKLFCTAGILAYLASATIAYAANQKPTDVPTAVNPGATFAAGTTLNKLGPTGTATTPDTPAFFANMGPDYPTPNRLNWMDPSAPSIPGEYIDVSGGGEAKFRFHINSIKAAFDDPVRNFNEPGGSHCHEFFGNRFINANSTYQSLRTRLAKAGSVTSTASGGPLNNTGYWVPCQILTIGGNTYAAQSWGVAGYYVEGLSSRSTENVRLARKLRYVTATNMDDPDDLFVKAEIVTANAQPGTSGRYSYSGDGWGGWRCITSGGTGTDLGLHKWLKNSDGTDPWGGACTSGSILLAEVFGPRCWNGIDPWAPGGYRHMRHEVYDNVRGRLICPDGWYYIPALELKFNYLVNGFSDYGNRRLSSDNAAGIAAGRTFRNGESFHADWFGGWDDETLINWHAKCVGVPNLSVTNQPHTCATSVINSTQRLRVSNAPDGSRNPQILLTTRYDPTVAADNYRIRTGTANPTGNKDFTIQ